MKLAIMQPYFFPYLGYFSLMEYADQFILFDTPQYDRKGWMHRNRVLHLENGWVYIRARIKKPEFKAAIKNVQIDKQVDWEGALLNQLSHYKKYAKYYKNVILLLESIFGETYNTLSEFNFISIKHITNYLGIECPVRLLSEMDINISDVQHPGQWALNISKAVGAKEYINPMGGKEIFKKKEFLNLDIKLSFLKNNLSEYNQFRDSFEAGLSIVDVMMFNSQQQVKNLLNHYELS